MKILHKYIIVDSSKIHYIESGKGKPIILIHGLGYSWKSWRKNIPALSKKFRVIALDLPSCSDSENLVGKKHTIKNFAIFIHNFIKNIKIKKPIIIGTSLGGMIAVEYSMMFPKDVDKLITVCTPFYFPLHLKKITKLERVLPGNVLKKIMNVRKMKPILYKNMSMYDFVDIKKRLNEIRYMEEVIPNMTKKSFFETLFDLLKFDKRKSLKRIKVPFMIIESKNEKMIKKAEFVKFFPRIKHVEISGSKHYLIVEKAGVFNKIVLDFLKQ